MDSKELSRRGGLARAKNLSPERLSEIACKAGKASGKVRRKLAKEKKRLKKAKALERPQGQAGQATDSFSEATD